MIGLLQNSQMYNNDLRAMLMAFYPGVKISEKDFDRTKDGVDKVLDFILVAHYKDRQTTLYIVKDCEIKKDNDEASIEKYINECSTSNSTASIEDSIIIQGEYQDKEIFRNKLKLASYELISKKASKKLPWGCLTGVRPTKIAMKQLNENKTFEEAVDNYIKVYDTSMRKAKLATTVAVNESRLVSAIDFEKDYCLYIGIPFCPSRCLYCSFTSYPIGTYKDKADAYIEKLCEELKFIKEAYKTQKLAAIYVGGGTPTAISAEQLEMLLKQICDLFDVSKILEFTVESGRPDSITMDKLKVMKKYNVGRISINPQTMNDETLKIIGRAHNSEQTRQAFAMAREAGFDNINMDLIAGLPGENIDSMKYTLSEIEKLSPESITVHSLAIKRAANLKQQMGEYGSEINQDMDAMLDMVSDLASKLSMEPYYLYRQKNIGGNLENVGYAKNGKECLYNILIMEEMTDIVAAGAGASTKLTFHKENRVERIENCKSVDDYIGRFEEMLERKKNGFKNFDI